MKKFFSELCDQSSQIVYQFRSFIEGGNQHREQFPALIAGLIGGKERNEVAIMGKAAFIGARIGRSLALCLLATVFVVCFSTQSFAATGDSAQTPATHHSTTHRHGTRHHSARRHAAHRHHRSAAHKSSSNDGAPVYKDRFAALVIDGRTGNVLYSANADAPRHPASMTKMMTLYMAFKALDDGRIELNDRLPVSEHAASQDPTKLDLRPGQTITVHDAILGMVTESANDAAVVLAEGLGGTESAFARDMTHEAHALGMRNTTFVNASGLPDNRQISTARDFARLAQALIYKYPKYYPYFSTADFQYEGVDHRNHNHLMERYDGMDGIKTGFIRASGFNLAASAVRDNHRLIAVVFGGKSATSRDNYVAQLLDQGFTEETRQASAQPVKDVTAIRTASVLPQSGIGSDESVGTSSHTDEMSQLVHKADPDNSEQDDDTAQ